MDHPQTTPTPTLHPNRPILSYLVEGEGPTVVLVHGVGSNMESWDEVVRRLSPSYRCIRMDLRGHGRSSLIRETYSLEKFCEDIIMIMDVEAVSKAHLVGFSLGGLIGQCLAVNWPERFDKIALLSAVANRTPEEREKVVSRLEMIREGGIVAVTGAAKDRWFTDEFARDHPQEIDKRIAELIANDKDSYMEAYRVFGTSEMGPRLHEIKHETLVLTGEFDQGSNTRMAHFMNEQIANSKLVILPRYRHSIMVEASDVVADHLLEFLRP
ncbi:pimeloyl-ACP methyl ester carboxylesterase [Rhodoligotrophos appendicifer]|uniref:alpha/beta fold hydrolase n=1 Tax=Rhodoligotrophos appendicifer TaxID=987056 RepID=UPI001185B4D3|nr:alpha/beta hydrolase [Rhodoligotrophos appendicifer]